MTVLQAVGVAAGIVSNAADVYNDPQLRERGLLWPIEHSEMKKFTHLGSSMVLSKTPAQATAPSPCMGEHNKYILTKILGRTDAEYRKLLDAGVLE
jgi:crotonobetainyl-CoA:carnitine CoA-transferase CaiB-like acyl-CoA transferase